MANADPEVRCYGTAHGHVLYPFARPKIPYQDSVLVGRPNSPSSDAPASQQFGLNYTY